MSRLYEEDRNEESPVFNPLYPAPDMFLYHDTSSVFSHLLYPPPSQSSPDHTLDCDSGYSDWIVPFGSQPTPHSGLHHDTRTEQSLWPELLKVRHLTGSEENLSLSELILILVTDNGTDDNPAVIHSFSLADPPRVDQETVPGLELLVTPPRGVPSSGDTDCFYNTTGSQLLYNSCWYKPEWSSDKILSEITIRESMYFKLCQSGLGRINQQPQIFELLAVTHPKGSLSSLGLIHLMKWGTVVVKASMRRLREDLNCAPTVLVLERVCVVPRRDKDFVATLLGDVMLPRSEPPSASFARSNCYGENCVISLLAQIWAVK